MRSAAVALIVLACCLATAAGLAAGEAQREAQRIDFATRIRPILSEHCFACHGPDQATRKGGLRLDTRAGALAKLDEGPPAIVPGDPKASALIARIVHADPGERMPPKKKPGPTPAEVELLRAWIAQGAHYAEHWAFVAPTRPAPPATKDAAWATNDIDRFVLARLEREGLKPQPEAARETLIRRVTLDITGLTPTPEEVDAFLADRSPGAYERVVDRLLASPRYGERMATPWLDAARYADSHGFQTDWERFQWRWRDWVIAAFNADMPFDRFTLLQTAGDLIPGADQDSRIATGFHRNHRISSEGGIDPEEWRLETVFDRTETTATVWLGLTMGCARCHDHKYDPIPQRDYFRFAAFFDSIAEKGIGHDKAVNVAPLLKLPEGGDMMVLEELPKPRETFVLQRGTFGQRGEKVDAGTPAFLPPMAADAPRNRLGLARWLTDRANPLTARVQANRLWEQCFGTGIVASGENLGSQAEPPSHAELLDWLAVELMEQGWSLKKLLRAIVTSATYRQSAAAPAALIARDPANRLLGRGARFRLGGEMLRDQSLAAAGLLSGRIGGASARPYQPRGIWEGSAGGGNLTQWKPDAGEGLWRRGLYTFWKRTQPPISLAVFDAPSREFCSVRRARTNTPLQALAMLNDETTTVAARALALRVIAAAATPAERLTLAFRLVLGRRPDAAELAILGSGLERRRARYASDAKAALELLAVGAATAPTGGAAPAELAAYAQTCAVILNLDEALTRE